MTAFERLIGVSTTLHRIEGSQVLESEAAPPEENAVSQKIS
jgi:hypothetical protein